MARLTTFTVSFAVALGVGCSLLTPYPGDEDPASLLGDSVDDDTFDTGEVQEPLVDPAIDDSINVIRNLTKVIAHPGEAFPIDLEFDAPNGNVVGGGIQFPGSNEVQWTFIPQLDGEVRGDIRFGFVVDKNICSEVPNLCHEIKTQQFAVARNDSGDVDGDGQQDGEFVVSPPVEVTVILACATCESPSCLELLPEGECQQCSQAPPCSQYFSLCLDPSTNDDVTDEDREAFNAVFGPMGALWTTRDGCVLGEGLCQEAVDVFNEQGMECRLGGGEAE